VKACPVCKSTYPQNFAVCPRDGTPLSEVGVWSEGAVIRGKYRILSKIGEGGMGAVYKALHLRFNELRALKVISVALAAESSFVNRFEKEAVLTRKLQHPNAVRVDDIDEAEDGRPFIVMEYIEGRDLKRVIQAEGTLAVPRVCSIVRQVAAALDAAHELGIVHRDIKPENVVLIGTPGREQAKVLDFGIAKIREAGAEQAGGGTMTATGVIIGSPSYMSPEQAQGMKGDQLDGRSDLYSLGVVMYQMLTGLLPLKADTTMSMLMAHIQTPPTPLRVARPDLHVPDSVAELVMQLLEKKREARPPSARAVIEAIDQAETEVAALGGMTVVGPPSAALLSGTASRARTPSGSASAPVPLTPTVRSQPVGAMEPLLSPAAAETKPRPSSWHLKLLVGIVVILLLGIAWLVHVNRLKQQAADRPNQEFEFAHKLGHELMEQKDFDGAAHNFRAALKLRPDFDELRIDLGLALEAENKKREALVEFEVVCARTPNYDGCDHYRKLLNELKQTGPQP